MRLDIAAQTDIGRRKKNNEDYYAIFREDTPNLQFFDEGSLICVADGLGGHSSGEIASKLAVKVFADILRSPPPEVPNPEEAYEDDPYLQFIRQHIIQANRSVFQTNQDLIKGAKPMGTTLLSALVTPRTLYIGNVGDSRAYLFRDGEIIEKTQDHSWVDEQVKAGLMSKAEAESDSRKNFVTRSIGTHAEVGVDTYRWHIVPGDWILLCTDGLVNMVRDKEIKEFFQKNDSAAEITGKLVDLANDNGGKDNITVVVIHVSPSFFRMVYLRLRAFVRKQEFKLVWLLVTFLLSVACFFAGGFAHRRGWLDWFFDLF